MIDYEALRSSGGRSPDERRHGIGIACFVKSTGTGIPYEGRG